MPSSNFDWQADDEQDWEKLDESPETGERKLFLRYRRWWLVLLIFGGALVLIFYFLLNNRVSAAVEQTRSEVLTAHQLLLQAAEAQDFELFSSLVSNQERTWFRDQAELLSLDLFWGRSALNLEPAGDLVNVDEDIKVDISPDLNQAIVTQPRSFIAGAHIGITMTVELERDFYYELSDRGWQLARLGENTTFWGGWESDSEENLTLVYPMKDAQVGRRLLPNLDKLVGSLCADPALNCPEGMDLELKLDRREESLFRISEGYPSAQILLRNNRGILTLPAPSLVGRPLDDKGYEALAQGYASWLGAVLINNFAVNEDSADPELIRTVLAAHDLVPPPWPKAKMPWDTVIDVPNGAELPPNDILMLCTGGNQQRLLRFKTAEAKWANEWPFKAIRSPGAAPGFPQPNFARLPDYSGVLVTFYQGEDQDKPWQTYLWKNGQTQHWLDHNDAPHFWTTRLLEDNDPNAGSMIGYYLSIDDNRSNLEFWSLDLAQCEAGSCEVNRIDGAPLWSPDGEHSLLTVLAPFDQPELHLGDGQGRSEVNLGTARPVTWVDNETYVYLRHQIVGYVDPTQRGIWRELVIGKVGSQETEVIIDSQSFKSLISLEKASMQLGIVDAEPYKDGWLIAVRELGHLYQMGSYLMFYQPESNRLELEMVRDMEITLPPLALDLGGPYLAIAGLRDEDFLLRFVDMENGDEVFRANRFPVDWSADRQWLLFVEERQLRVAAPALGFEWTIEHNLPNCYSAVWINRE